MRRVMSKKDYSQWLSAFFPSLTARTSNWLAPATVTDKTDVNRSPRRAEHQPSVDDKGIMQALPEGDKRLPVLKKALVHIVRPGSTRCLVTCTIWAAIGWQLCQLLRNTARIEIKYLSIHVARR